MSINHPDTDAKIAKILRDDVLKAIRLIIKYGRDETRTNSQIHGLMFEGKSYPPKEVLRVAHLVALGRLGKLGKECEKFKKWAKTQTDKSRLNHGNLGEFSWKNYPYRWMLNGPEHGHFNDARTTLAYLGFEIQDKKKPKEKG